ncbi:sigma factor-like helix-turn-helix DNA-binding protein [Lysobacter cavernae]|uniref:Sigma factor-like helix-turn-helix DNA-binding protein n=1 Tax=Lysobacter cavernae TaxID=1685901 RepID=A0ABV7RPZ3_9GAMM
MNLLMANGELEAARMGGHDIAAVLESLSAHYHQVMLLRDREGLSIAGMADHPALTREAVKSRRHRARVLARECPDR